MRTIICAFVLTCTTTAAARQRLAMQERPMVMAARTVEATTPIEPGLIEIQAHVTLTVSIK